MDLSAEERGLLEDIRKRKDKLVAEIQVGTFNCTESFHMLLPLYSLELHH